MPTTIPCRIVSNDGDIEDGRVAMDYRTTLLGYKVAAPSEYINNCTSRYRFDHFTERGMAVYLEVE